MKQIYRSEDGKVYETKDEAVKADEVYAATQKKTELAKAERKEAAKKVQDAFQNVADAKKAAADELKKFTDKYGHYSATFTGDAAKNLFTDPFDLFFDHFLI